MGKRVNLSSIAILVTLGFFGLASNWTNGALWGINHLAFLGQGWMIAYAIISILIVTILFSKRWDNFLSQVLIKTHDFIFEKGIWPKVLITLLFTFLFYTFRSETHFLGDGYTWLSVFGQGEIYIHKWSETGSIFLFRIIQNILGGYTEETALLTFQVFSIFSGSIIVYNSISIIKILITNPHIRLLSLFTIIFSGSLLLFFGYVEFYPLSWSVSFLFLNMALRSLNKSLYLWLTLVLFLIAVFVHVQAVFFLPGLISLLIIRIQSAKLRKIFWGLFFLLLIAGLSVFIWLYNNMIEFEILILPIFEGRPVAPEYAVFSFLHLFDLINLLFLVAPGVLILIVFWFSGKLFIKRDSISLFLITMSIGSISFLLIYGAAITMARDWDVMSLSFVTPLFFVLYQLDNSKKKIPVNLLVSYFLMVVIITGSYLSVSVNTTSSESRFYSLLNDRNRSGWAIYANYLRDINEMERYKEITSEMNSRFPEYLKIKIAYDFLEKSEFIKARGIAESLVASNPFEPNFLQLIAGVYGKSQKYNEAVLYYDKATKLNPYYPELFNEFGQLYMEQQKYDSALIYLKRARNLNSSLTIVAEGIGLTYFYLEHNDSSLSIADSLFIDDPNSPGGHLLKMVVAISQKQKQIAKDHYIEYLKYGKQRSDYRRISERYGYLSVE